MRNEVKKVKDLFEQEKNGTRYMFRLLGLQVVSVWGFRATQTVNFNITNRGMRNTLIENRVVKYNKENGRLGLTQKGWDMWFSDAKKYGYGIPDDMLEGYAENSELENMKMADNRTLAEQITDLTIKLNNYKDIQPKPLEKDFKTIQAYKSALNTWTHKYEIKYKEKLQLQDQQSALIQTLEEVRAKRKADQEEKVMQQMEEEIMGA